MVGITCSARKVILHRHGSIAPKTRMNFGINDDQFLLGTLPLAAPEIIEHEGQTYIASLLPSLKGIRIAKLEWGTTKETR